MRIIEKGDAVYFEVGAIREADGSIHLTSAELPDFDVKVHADAGRSNGHPTLFKCLDALLRRARRE